MSKMQYLCLIYTDEKADAVQSEVEQKAVLEAYFAFNEEAKAAGVLMGGEPLKGTDTATTVRIREGKTLFTDGPFAETKEQLGGYYLLSCADMDEALKWAAKIPAAAHGSVEVRPLLELDLSAIVADRANTADQH